MIAVTRIQDRRRHARGLVTGDPQIVQQHLRDEVDINTIVRRFGATRQMPSGPAGGVYGDFTGITDFESAVAAVERAREGFMALAPEVRERFGNDVGRYIAHVDQLEDSELGPEVGGMDAAAETRPAGSSPPPAP